MKRILCTIAVLIVSFGVTTTAVPQMQPGMIDFTPSMNARVANMNSDLAMAEYNRNAVERKRVAELHTRGNAIIKAGNATTKIVPSIEGTKWLAQEINWFPTSPQDLPGQIRFIQRYVGMFDKLMLQNGFTPNDATDGLTFSTALSYAASHDKEMNKPDVEKLRREWREYLLKSPGFQGSSEKGKQYTYEQNAFMAMQAVEQRIIARRATTENERKTAVEKAQHFAQFMLESK